MAIFCKTVITTSIPLKQFMEAISLNNAAYVATSTKILLRVLKAQTRNADIVETVCTGWTDLFAVWY
jgi:hypothetical protein